MKKILICFGTRPEAIKMAPVIHELKDRGFNYKVCVTAQHREMLDQVLAFFEIIPDVDLDLMKPNQSLNALSAGILQKMDEVLEKEMPNLVLVQGDTTTAAMVALAAFHRHIFVGHIEAGLRTNNKNAPYPEEVNRQLISRIADFHFAPTSLAKENLLKEQVHLDNTLITGNTVVDALNWGIKKLRSTKENEEVLKIRKRLTDLKRLILVTGHRRENFGEGLKNICEALIGISKEKDVEIVFPVHPNPNVVEPVKEMLMERSNIFLIDPVSYPTMLWLMDRAHFVISDSGGIQEEAPALKKPVLVTREVSERMEGVTAGFSILVGTNKDKIIEEANKLLETLPDFSSVKNPFGNGTASKSIVDFLEKRIELRLPN